MAASKKKYRLSNIIELKRCMKILIDDYVEQDENGNYVVNVGYTRVSTDKQADKGYGLEIQEAAVLNYCKMQNFPNLLLFVDDGQTGTKMDRPALNEIVAMIERYNDGTSNIRINTMVIPRIDRLGRTLLGMLQFVQDYIVAAKDSRFSEKNRNKEDINFISVQENYCRIDKDDPQSKLMLMLFATLAEYDRDMIVGKMRDGRNARVASGKWMGGGNIPYGYRYDKDKGTLVIQPEEAAKVKEIFRLFIEEKMSPQKIADMLGFKGDKIIREILKRKSLTGCIIWHDEEYQGNHEAIIPLERWEEAQEEFEKRSVHRADSHYLLAGLVVCGECGAKMRYQKWNKDNACKLVCYSTQKSNHQSKSYLVKDENCPNPRYWASEIENAVVAQLFEMEYLGREADQKADQYIDPVAALEKELRELDRKLSIWYDKLDEHEKKGLDTDVLEDKIDNALQRKKEVKYMLSNANVQRRIHKKVDKAKELLRTLKDTWPSMTAEQRQAACRELIKHIKIYTRDGDTYVDVELKLQSYLIKK